MAPRSLAEMCVRVAVVNVNLITGFGDLPVNDNMREILRAVKTAQQLRSIELGTSDPFIYEETEPIWKRIIQKKFPSLARQHNWAPDKPESWHKVYDRYTQEWDRAQAAAIANLKAAVAADREKKESNKATIVNASELRGLGAREPRKTTHWSVAQPKKPNKSFIEKARNQVRQEVSRFRPANAPRILPANLGKVERAPASMINDKRIEAQYNPRKQIASVQQIIAPRIRASADSESLKTDRERKEREERLLRIKGGRTKGGADMSSPPRPTILRFDDDEDKFASGTPDQDEDFDDLFGDEPPSRNKSSMISEKAKSSLLDIDSIEALYTKPSGSPPTRSNFTSSRPSNASPPADRRRGGLLSAAPGASKASIRASSTTKTPPALAKSKAAASPPTFENSRNSAGLIDTPAVAYRPLSSMTAEDAQNIESNIQATSAGPTGQPQPRRIIKRKQSVNPLVPAKRVRR